MDNNEFYQEGNARFSLFVALACVDGKLGDDEKVKLKELAQKYGINDDGKYDEIIENYQAVLDGRIEIEKAKYIHEILTSVPENEIHKLEDLKNCNEIINADNDVTEAEKNAFDIICRFYGVKKELFDNKNKKDYEAIFNNIDEVNNNSKGSGKCFIKKIQNKLKNYLAETDENNEVRIQSDGYSKIEEIFQYNIIKGPLLGGIKYALEKRYNKVTRNKIRSDKNSTVFAFIIFAFSAFTLLLNINADIDSVIERNIVENKIKEVTTDIGKLNELESVNDTITSDIRKILEQKLSLSYKEKYSTENRSINNSHNNNAVVNDSCGFWRKVYSYIAPLKDLITCMLDSAERRYFQTDDMIYVLSFSKTNSRLIYAVVAILIYVAWRCFRFVRHKVRNNPIVSILLVAVMILLFSGKHSNSILLLYTMLSIEWLILMKDKSAETSQNSAPLTLLVIMAILSDISFGMVELQQMYTLHNVLDKIFSALFLGCICFFFGKFLDIQYRQNKRNREEMRLVLEKINKT